MISLNNVVAALAILPVLAFSATAQAAPLSNDQFYGAYNYTQNGEGDFDSVVSTTACNDVVLFGVNIPNLGETGTITDITVGATLPTANSAVVNSTATVSAATGAQMGFSVASTATVNLAANSHLKYVADSTEVYHFTDVDDLSKFTNTAAADGIANGEIKIGDLQQGQVKFVSFAAQVICDSVPANNPTTPNPADKPIDATKPVGKDISKSKQRPTMLVNTGPGATILAAVGVTVISAMLYGLVLRRR